MGELWIFLGVFVFYISAYLFKLHLRYPTIGRRFYFTFGLAMLSLFSCAEYWGWGYVDSDKIKGVPKTVRQNPGVYRSHYRSYGRTYGGK